MRRGKVLICQQLIQIPDSNISFWTRRGKERVISNVKKQNIITDNDLLPDVFWPRRKVINRGNIFESLRAVFGKIVSDTWLSSRVNNRKRIFRDF